MLTINKCIDNINSFFYNYFTFEETSKTELINFLSNYVNYILLLNGLNAEEISVQLHFVRKSELKYEQPEFSIKEKFKKKHKQRNKENSKKQAYNKGLTTLTYMSGIVENNSFDIYLNEELCKLKNLEATDDLIEIIYNIGHEVEHIVQTYKQEVLWQAVDLYKDKQFNAFYEKADQNPNNRKYLRKLSEKFQKHADNYEILNTTEILADQNSNFYFNTLYALIKNTTDDEYYKFLTYIKEGVNLAQQCREIDYTLWLSHDNLIVKCLTERFNISPEVLTII